VKMTGGYDPGTTLLDSLPVRVEAAIYKRNGIDPIVWPCTAGSWPAFLFTGPPLQPPALQFSHGVQSPDECCRIESQNPKVTAPVRSRVEFLCELAAAG
jgi:hypothetical protein